MNGHELIARIRKLGRRRGVAVLLLSERGRGSHASLTFGGRTAVIPHRAAELKKGTLHGILKQLGLKLEDLR